MNQLCKVCGEPAAGFHFGAFTCEGCKSFFGRSYNNLSSISECKNNGECVINKKNRTSCKACRLRKCLMVGMSKSGSRYGRRSNWFKIHCLLQEQQHHQKHLHHSHQQYQQQPQSCISASTTFSTYPLKHLESNSLNLSQPFLNQPNVRLKNNKLRLLSDNNEGKHSVSIISSPESHTSETSIEDSGLGRVYISQLYKLQNSLSHHNILQNTPFPGFLYPPVNNNNEIVHSSREELFSKKLILDAVLLSQTSVSPVKISKYSEIFLIQEDPIDLSVKNSVENVEIVPNGTLDSKENNDNKTKNNDSESNNNGDTKLEGLKQTLPTPLDLTSSVICDEVRK